jgi:hypothetical protein
MAAMERARVRLNHLASGGRSSEIGTQKPTINRWISKRFMIFCIIYILAATG